MTPGGDSIAAGRGAGCAGEAPDAAYFLSSTSQTPQSMPRFMLR